MRLTVFTSFDFVDDFRFEVFEVEKIAQLIVLFQFCVSRIVSFVDELWEMDGDLLLAM